MTDGLLTVGSSKIPPCSLLSARPTRSIFRLNVIQSFGISSLYKVPSFLFRLIELVEFVGVAVSTQQTVRRARNFV